MTPGRWALLMQEFGVGSHLDTYERLVAAYSEPHRHYHTATHIAACLAEFDAARELATFAGEVQLALWFHDAVYSPAASDNEVRSANWAAQFLSCAGVQAAACERVHAHIMATQHNAQPGAGDSALVVDVDLSILGQKPETYREFENNVRAEYRWVPWSLYRRKRGEILQSFLERDSIYVTARFRERYESQAQSNIRDALRSLAK
jgi:predicted metal-dependent HD superfamily phosphohydrolase